MRRTFLILMVSMVFLAGCGQDCYYGGGYGYQQPYNPNCAYQQYPQTQYPQPYPQYPQYPQYPTTGYPPTGGYYPPTQPPVYPCPANNPYCYHEVQE